MARTPDKSHPAGHHTSTDSRLASRIRLSYIILMIPLILLLFFLLYLLRQINVRYEKMLNSVVTASEFSLDFKKDFDYETYLVIAGNMKPAESSLGHMLDEAERVLNGLEDYTMQDDNRHRLESAQKYVANLRVYIGRIYDNLENNALYEDNMLIWENDVQIVTALLQETINEYIYYENRELQTEQAKNKAFTTKLITVYAILIVVVVVIVLLFSYFEPIRITRPIEEQVRAEQIRLRHAEFELLQAQINPHFLYNTLDAIVWSAESGNEKQVVRMVTSLSDFFRGSLSRGKELVSVREDLQHVRSYLEIQQIRYQDILRYAIVVPDEMAERKIPKITLQPLVENALYHGIKNRRGGGGITIDAEDDGGVWYLTVRDDGIGMTEERLEEVRRGLVEKAPAESAIYGLYNVNERIRLNFGEGYGLRIESIYGEGTAVTIVLPVNPS